MIQTDLLRVKNAIRYVQYDGAAAWMIIGKNDPWSSDDATYGMDGATPPSDTNPPIPQPSTLNVPEAFAAIKCTIINVVEDDVNGTYLVKDSSTPPVTRKYAQLSNIAAVITAMSNLILYVAIVDGSDLPYSSFRAYGFSTDLVPTSGYESETSLTAEQVSNWGTLECLEYRTPMSIVSGDAYQVTSVLGV